MKALAPFAVVLLAVSAWSASGEADWPQWRGPHGTGMAAGPAPTTWSDTENVKWRVAIPGRGHSTPIAWGERLYLTTAVAIAEAGEASGSGAAAGGRFEPGGEVGAKHAFLVLCLERKTGKVIWERTAREDTPHEGFHKTYGSFASASPVTDGKVLVVSFGSWGLYAFDLDGEPLWEFDPEVDMTTRNQFGEGTSPALYGDTVVQVYDHEGDSFVVALDLATGKERWRAPRDEPTTWAMPLILEHDGVTQAIVSGTNKVRSYRLSDGELIWECAGLGVNAIPVPVLQDDVVLLMTGYRNANLMAVKLGGKGDLTGGDHVLWSTTKGLSYTASPVLHDGTLYCLMDRGFMSAFDARTGEPHYVEQRLPRGSNFKASPVGADGKLYLAAESGDVHVLEMGPELKVLATNTLEGQSFVSSPLIVEGELFLRGPTDLICIREADAK